MNGIAKTPGDFFKKPRKLGIGKLDNRTARCIDQMIVARRSRAFVARTAVAEVALGNNTLFLKQPERPVHGRHTDPGATFMNAPMQKLDIGMIGGLGQNTKNKPPSSRNLEARLRATLVK